MTSATDLSGVKNLMYSVTDLGIFHFMENTGKNPRYASVLDSKIKKAAFPLFDNKFFA